MNLESLLRRNRVIRAIGIDDSPFKRGEKKNVAIAGVVCAGTRFEGMVWGKVRQDGWNATEAICKLLLNSKFLPQLDLVLLDGITLGGLNIIDLPKLYERLELPCVALMRRFPDIAGMKEAISRLPNPQRRNKILERAGEIYSYPPFVFQVCGEKPDAIASALQRLTDCGKVPEALRLAHLIGAAIIKGESGRQA